jgi:hypothetical protein
MPITATVYIHPTVANPFRIFEIRRIAREYGCSFATTKPKHKGRTAPAPFDPNDGGHAA